jgi:hypothetical protein
MRSVADDLRALTLARVLALPVAARIKLALSLGDDDLDRFVQSSGLERGDALNQLRAQRTHGRRTSRSAVASTP